MQNPVIKHSALTPILITGISLFFISCEKLYPKVEIPSYLQIEEINLTTTYQTEGSNNNNITDAWVFINDQAIGTFELPATIPILAAGSQEIKIWAGIKENGISTTRKMYPFYEYHLEQLSLTRGEINTMEPAVQYYSGISFEWIENFDLGSTLTKASTSDTGIQFTTIDTVSGLGTQSAIIHMDNNRPYFEIVTDAKQFTLPTGPPVYLEINYLCSNSFSVSLVKNTLQGSEKLNPYITMNPSGQWKTIYVNLTSLVSQQTNAISFEVYFNGELDPSHSSGYVILDNLKLIHSG